jgi:hypothetical protein
MGRVQATFQMSTAKIAVAPIAGTKKAGHSHSTAFPKPCSIIRQQFHFFNLDVKWHESFSLEFEVYPLGPIGLGN